MKVKLSVAICTYNRSRSLEKCLASLTELKFKDFEVIIIDGGSTDGTHEVISGYSEKLKISKYILRTDQLSPTRDMAWRKSRGELVAWIDDDVVVDSDWASSLVEIMEADPGIGGVSGPTLIPKELKKGRDVFFFYNKTGIIGSLAKLWNILFLEGDMHEPGLLKKSGAWTPGSNFRLSLKIKGLKNVDYLEACNMTLRRKLIKEVGGFDYGYIGVAEWSELDVAKRVQELGYKLVFSSKVKVNHNVSTGGAYSRRPQAKWRMENFYKFYFRHIFKPHPSYIFKFLLYLMFLNTYWTYKAISTKNLKWLGGWVGSVTGLKYANKKK